MHRLKQYHFLPLPPASASKVIKRAIANLLRGRGKDNNVLCSGASDKGWRLRQSGGGGGPPQPAHNDRDIPAVRALDTSEWRLLLSRIGDQQMLRLLQECSIFLPLPNMCFLQVSGEPISKVAYPIPPKLPPLPPHPAFLPPQSISLLHRAALVGLRRSRPVFAASRLPGDPALRRSVGAQPDVTNTLWQQALVARRPGRRPQ